MTTKIQKEKERSQFYEFKALYSGFPEGEIDDNSENPDFLIKTDNGVIGIEHVAYIREQKLGQKSGGSRLRKEENVANQFVQVAQNYFDSKISDPLIVDFSWYGNKEINKRDANILAEYVVDAIEAALPLPTSAYKYIGPETFEDTPLEEYLHAIFISKPAKLKTSKWHNVERGFTELGQNELQTIISGKEKKINLYLENCDKVWLLIVANGEHISSVLDFPNQPIVYSFQTRFERVFICDRVHQKVVVIK